MTSSRDMDVTLISRSLCDLNMEALKHYKAAQYSEAVAVYGSLFSKVKKQNLTHAELYSCYNNCAAALLHLKQYEAALQYAEAARKLAEQALKRQDHPPFTVSLQDISSRNWETILVTTEKTSCIWQSDSLQLYLLAHCMVI